MASSNDGDDGIETLRNASMILLNVVFSRISIYLLFGFRQGFFFTKLKICIANFVVKYTFSILFYEGTITLLKNPRVILLGKTQKAKRKRKIHVL